MSSNFYQNLPAFGQFEDFTRGEYYHELPHDWVVVVTDIRNSTRAIDSGKYKEVNLIGAASITQTMLALHTQDIPFVFGGDGASICVPHDEVAVVIDRLGKLQRLALENFELELRVAVIPMSAVRNRRKKVLVAKLEITRDKFIAVFRGGGLAEADMLAKQSYKRFAIKPVAGALDNLEGLSCRWSPIPSRKGTMVSLLVSARGTEAMEVYRNLIGSFRQAMGREISDANPVLDNLAQYKTMVQAIREEYKYNSSVFSMSFFRRLLEIVFSVMTFRYGLNPVKRAFDDKAYKNSISHHSDYRKFDDTLRLIMDCTQEELDKLQSLLEEGYRKGHLYYGLYTSGEALMTCFLESPGQGRHLHFIDGGDGGLAMAARQMKKQVSPA